MAATAYQIQQLSTPTIIVDDVTVPIVPNSCTMRIPGDFKVRAMSVGNGSVTTVSGLNAESLVAHVKFEIAATAENVDRVRNWKSNAMNGLGSTIQIVTQSGQYAFQTMFLTKDMDTHMRSDGNISADWEGQFVS
jgi:hypothetical protein